MNDIFRWLTASGITLFGVVGWLCLGVVAWMNIRWRVKTLESNHAAMVARHDKLETIIEKQVELTRNVELNSVKLAEIAKNTERRLQLCEDRLK